MNEGETVSSFLPQVCLDWKIPFLSLDGMEADAIPGVVEAMEPRPKVLLATISVLASEAVQRAIRKLPIRRICIDEAQVPPYCPPALLPSYTPAFLPGGRQ